MRYKYHCKIFNLFKFFKSLSSIFLSSPEVVSSKITSEGSEARQIAIASLCVCPPLREFPSSFIYSRYLFGRFSMNSSKQAILQKYLAFFKANFSFFFSTSSPIIKSINLPLFKKDFLFYISYLSSPLTECYLFS